jgi:hypothetical protein
LKKPHIFITMEQETKPKRKIKPNITKTQWLGFIRHTLTMVGGGFIASGQLTEAEAMEGIGYIVGAVGFVWSFIKNN